MSLSPTDRAFVLSLRAATMVTGAVVVVIFVFVAREAWPLLHRLGPARFLGDPSWYPAAPEPTFGLAPMLSGTLAAALGALLLAAPLGLLSAVFCHAVAPAPLARLYRRLVELLAGIPSVVYGFWGLVVLVPLILRIEPPGASLLAGILVLAIMVLPTVALSADAAFAAVPRHLVQGAAALGLSRTTTLLRVVMPASRSGLATGLLLAAGRAVGETMAVLMVCGNVVQHPSSLFDPIRTLSANIALEMAYALGDHRAALFVSGLLLMVVVGGLVFLASHAARVAGVESSRG